jgi:hypothetical protein
MAGKRAFFPVAFMAYSLLAPLEAIKCRKVMKAATLLAEALCPPQD